MLTKVGERLMESVDKRVRKEISALTDLLDEYCAYTVDKIRKELAEDGAEIARLMVALTTAKTTEERRAVLLKLSAAAKAGALSPAKDSDWSGKAPNSSGSNKASITPGRTFQREQHEKQTGLANFNEVDSPEEAILSPDASPMSRYCAAVSRHVRKG